MSAPFKINVFCPANDSANENDQSLLAAIAGELARLHGGSANHYVGQARRMLALAFRSIEGVSRRRKPA
jgi:hypothetical protein